MLKKIILLLFVMILPFGVASCKDSGVKYISNDADELNGAVCYTASTTDSYNEEKPEEQITDDGVCQEEDYIPVHVCGAVNNPGVYRMVPGSLKEDALKLAGGFTQGAAQDYVNLAEKMSWGEKIYFPYEEELTEGYNISGESQGTSANGKVNINTATKDQLMTLPGIGESKAEAIIKYRDINGPFQSIEDITKISGIKEGVYNNIKDLIIAN